MASYLYQKFSTGKCQGRLSRQKTVLFEALIRRRRDTIFLVPSATIRYHRTIAKFAPRSEGNVR